MRIVVPRVAAVCFCRNDAIPGFHRMHMCAVRTLRRYAWLLGCLVVPFYADGIHLYQPLCAVATIARIYRTRFNCTQGALNQTIVKTKEIDASQQANRAGIDQVAARLEGLDERFKALRDGQELQGTLYRCAT